MCAYDVGTLQGAICRGCMTQGTVLRIVGCNSTSLRSLTRPIPHPCVTAQLPCKPRLRLKPYIAPRLWEEVLVLPIPPNSLMFTEFEYLLQEARDHERRGRMAVAAAVRGGAAATGIDDEQEAPPYDGGCWAGWAREEGSMYWKD